MWLYCTLQFNTPCLTWSWPPHITGTLAQTAPLPIHSSPTSHHIGLHALSHTLQWWFWCFKAFSFAVSSAWNTPFKIPMWPLPPLASHLYSNVNLSAKPFVDDLDLPCPMSSSSFFSPHEYSSCYILVYVFIYACPPPLQHKTYEGTALFSSLL